MTSDKPLHELMTKLDYQFKDDTLLRQALKHRSAGPDHNERLEFLGDSVLNFAIADILFRQFPNAREGQMSRLRADLVNKDALASIARDLNLGEHLILGQGEYKSGGTDRDSILSDCMEAVIAAMYLDSDMKTCLPCLHALYRSKLENLSLTKITKDAKSELQEYLQRLRLPLPEYELKSVKGKDHNQKFVMACRCNLCAHDVLGEGGSRRRAEQDAAKNMLALLQHDNQTSNE
ncbi:MAG: ribonuclease III [Pseudomonadota bacterium]